jgi:hypothetical protein
MKIADKYKPYNYSENKSFIITLTVAADGIYKIESKLPRESVTLTGIYISCSPASVQRVIGLVNLFFNEGILKNFSMPVMNNSRYPYPANPIPLNEYVRPNSTMQGVYYHNADADTYPFTIKIYLHYKETL